MKYEAIDVLCGIFLTQVCQKVLKI